MCYTVYKAGEGTEVQKVHAMKSQLSGLEYENTCMMRIYPIMCIRHPVLRNRKIAIGAVIPILHVPTYICTHTENKTKQALPVTCVQHLSSL